MDTRKQIEDAIDKGASEGDEGLVPVHVVQGSATAMARAFGAPEQLVGHIDAGIWHVAGMVDSKWDTVFDMDG